MNFSLNRVLDGLNHKRLALIDWRRSMPVSKKTIQLGLDPEMLVEEHVQRLEESIEAVNQGTLGLCEICHGRVDEQLLEVDYTAVVCLCHLSPGQMEQLQNEIELATSVQRALLPQEIPAVSGLQIAAYSRPAQFVGGDYFDFVPLLGNQPGLMIADIAGHGISAGLQMASIQALSRALIPTCASPAEAIARIHSLFVHNINFTTFVTLFLATYNPASHTLTYTSGGHNPPLIIRSTGLDKQTLFLEPTGPALGLIEDAIYTQKEIVLQTDDIFLMYTDGVIEAINSEEIQYGTEQLVDTVHSLAHLPLLEVLHGIRESLDQFIHGSPPEDDVTFVIARVV